jgi:uncharacterized protein YdiU (UPF0061 family)
MGNVIIKKYSCLLFGEGRKEKNFLNNLVELDKFKYHTRNWSFPVIDNGSGDSPENILKKCCSVIKNRHFDLILCFIDLDKLKEDYPDWEKEKERLEKEYFNFVIIWQIDNLEDEYRKILNKDKYKQKSKKKINKIAKENIKKFVNSDFWNKIINSIKNRERELINDNI